MLDKIILFSGKQFSGKDTVAKIMLEKMPDYRRCAIADMIKDTFGKQHGLTYEEIESNKAHYRPELLKLGNWGRALDPDFWLKQVLKQSGNVMVTDVRLKHEYEVLKAAGAKSIRVEAPREMRAQRGRIVGEYDKTETDLDDIKDWDFVINNNSTYEDLEKKVGKVIDILVK